MVITGCYQNDELVSSSPFIVCHFGSGIGEILSVGGWQGAKRGRRFIPVHKITDIF